MVRIARVVSASLRVSAGRHLSPQAVARLHDCEAMAMPALTICHLEGRRSQRMF